MIPTRGGSNVERIHASLRLHLRTQILGARQHIGVIVGGLSACTIAHRGKIPFPELHRLGLLMRRVQESASMIPLIVSIDLIAR